MSSKEATVIGHRLCRYCRQWPFVSVLLISPWNSLSALAEKVHQLVDEEDFDGGEHNLAERIGRYSVFFCLFILTVFWL